MNIHASCVCIKNKGILILGSSGSGKSDLCLRLIAEFGAMLVADDRVELQVSGNCVKAKAPQNLKNLLEVRGIGIIKLKAKRTTKISAVFELTTSKTERMPDDMTYNLCGIQKPLYKINPFEPSAPAKVLAALRLL